MPYIDKEQAIKVAVGALHGVSHVTAVDVAQALEDLPAVDGVPQSEWISVDEETPKDERERVLVLLVSNSVTNTMGSPRVDTDRFIDGAWDKWHKWVTHWMPLPEAPKMKGGE